MRVLLIGGYAVGMITFRGALMKQMQDLGCKISVLCSEHTDNDLQWFADHDIGYHAVPLSRTGTNPWHDYQYYRSLYREIVRENPAMVFCYAHKPIVFGVRAAKKAGVAQINAMIPGLGYGFSGEGGLKNRLVYKAITSLHRGCKRHISNLFFLNDTDYADFSRLGLIGKDTRATILPGEGKDLEGYAYSPLNAEGPVRFNLITRLLREKGVEDFVDAAGLVKQAFGEAQFDLVGPYDTNPGAIDADSVADWERRGLITYHGVTTDVPSYLRACSATVLPTTYREGLPMVLLEAMAIGRPVVAYENAGATQAVEQPQEIEPGLRQGSNGFLVQPGRVDLLAKSLLMLCRDTELVRQMGLAGRHYAETRFDVRKVNQQILQQIGLIPGSAPSERV